MSDVITRCGAGRQMNVGDVYSLRKDQPGPDPIFKKLPSGDIIRSTKNNKISVSACMDKSLQQRLQLLDIEPNIAINFLSGNLKPLGHLSFLFSEVASPKLKRQVILCQFLNSTETLNTTNHEIKNILNLTALKSDDFKHVVVGVSYGGKSTICLDSESPNDNVGGSLMKPNDQPDFDAIKRLGDSSDQKLTLFSDTTSKGLETMEDVLQFVSEFPSSVQKMNNGKGKTLLVSLMPIPTFLNQLGFFDVELPQEVPNVGSEDMSFYAGCVENVRTLMNKIAKTIAISKEFEALVDKSKLAELEDASRTLTKDFDDWKGELAKLVVLFKSGKLSGNELNEFFKKSSNVLAVRENKYLVNTYRHQVEKVQLLRHLKEQGATIVTSERLEEEISRSTDKNIKAFFYTEHSRKKNGKFFASNFEIFLGMLKAKDESKLYVVDLDRTLSSKADVHIKTYSKGVLTSEDVLGDMELEKCRNFVKSNEKRTLYWTEEQHRLEMPCPKRCSKDAGTWRCQDCKKFIEFDFVDSFTCQCGSAKASSFSFKCERHAEFVSVGNLTDELKCAKKPRELTILILGALGSGKTTLIQSICSYLTYNSLNDAEEDGLEVTIPETTNEASVWVFKQKDKIFRFIDTPGLGAGITEDRASMAKVMNLVRGFKKIQGICIVRDESSSLMAAYALEFIKSALSKLVDRNLVYCATRGAEMSGENLYAVDNSFTTYLRHLTTSSGQFDLSRLNKDWDNSKSKCLNMLRYFGSVPDLQVKLLTTYFDTRRLIEVLDATFTTFKDETEIFCNSGMEIKAHFESQRKREEEKFKMEKERRTREVKEGEEVLSKATTECELVKYEFDADNIGRFMHELIVEEIDRVADNNLDNVSVERMGEEKALEEKMEGLIRKWSTLNVNYEGDWVERGVVLDKLCEVEFLRQDVESYIARNKPQEHVVHMIPDRLETLPSVEKHLHI